MTLVSAQIRVQTKHKKNIIILHKNYKFKTLDAFSLKFYKLYLGTLTTSNLWTIFSATIALHCNEIYVLEAANTKWSHCVVKSQQTDDISRRQASHYVLIHYFFYLVLNLRNLSHPDVAFDDVIILLQKLNFWKQISSNMSKFGINWLLSSF